MKNKNREKNETQHFDNLIINKNTTWWGNETPAGKIRQHKRVQMLNSVLPKNSKLHLLELGCAIGEFTKRLADNEKLQITAIDISPQVIKTARSKINKKNVSFLTTNAYKLPFKDNFFDIICGNAILHHLDLEKTFPEIKRVAKKNAKLVFFEPNIFNPQVFIEKNVRFIGKLTQNSPDETAFNRFKLVKTLKSFNCKNISVVPFDFLHPLTPKQFITTLEKVAQILENTPGIKEFSGSLFITANI